MQNDNTNANTQSNENNEDTSLAAVVNVEHLTANKPIDPSASKGRQPGFDHLKVLNMDEFLINHDCVAMLIDHGWLRNLRLVSNPYMYRSLGRANYKTNTVELSNRLAKESIPVQREVFIRAISHFIAKKLFEETGDGKAYNLIVQRYMKRTKGQSNSTGNVTVLKTEEA